MDRLIYHDDLMGCSSGTMQLREIIPQSKKRGQLTGNRTRPRKSVNRRTNV
jgi:hypothetical protein